MLLPFKYHLNEEKAAKEDFGSLDNNSKGVLHELLVGMHLRGNHMDKHPDIDGNSPKQVHDELRKRLTPSQYKNFSDRAKKAADDILRERGMTRDDIGNVQWTSKHGDIKRATGIDSSQAEDDSDIILTHKNGTHHGVTLKVSDDAKPITLSNVGAESTYGGKKIFDKHKSDLLAAYPELDNEQMKNNPKARKAAVDRVVKKAAERGKPISSAEAKVGADDLRKAWLENNPKAKADIKTRTGNMLRNTVSNMRSELEKLSPEQLAHHVRHIVLHAYKTPKEALGHTHMRHFTGGGTQPTMEIKKPGEDYEHILSKPENIKVTHSGTSIYYHYHDPESGKTIPFAMQTAKVSSQSDPFSSLVMIGKDVARKQDESDHKRIKENYQKELATTKQSPGHLAPDRPITSNDIVKNDPILVKKKLSDVRPSVPAQERRVAQSGSPFQSMALPGIKRPPPSRRLSPEGIPEHMPQAHRDTESYMGFKQ
jgi:hypothetical protein